MKLNSDELLSNFAFKFNLRRYSKVYEWRLEPFLALIIVVLCFVYSLACVEAGAVRNAEIHSLVLLGRGVHSSTFRLIDTLGV